MTDESNYILTSAPCIPDQTVITKKSLHPNQLSVQSDLPPIISDPDSTEWYPSVNSYYPFTEDVDAQARVHHLLESKASTGSLEDTKAGHVNEYSEKRALHQYLRSQPISFLILGKPGLGQEEVGKRLADYWKCVYIDPLTLLEEEIASNSRPGQCIEFNLRCGRAVGADVLIRLLAKKVQTPYVSHRGFVCCGFPLIPNDLHEEDPISSESAVFNVKDIFEDIFDQAALLLNDSTQVVVSNATSKSNVSKSVDFMPSSPADSIVLSLGSAAQEPIVGFKDIESDYDKQLNYIFGLFQDPFVNIYLVGRNSDVVTIRNNYYFDIYSKKTLDMQKVRMFYDLGSSNEELTEDLFGEGRNPFFENPTLRHIVQLPEDLPANVRTQLDCYHKWVVNALDAKILMHEQQYYIKLDARLFFTKMLQLIKARLKILPVQQVIVPQRFKTFELNVGEADSDNEDISTEEALSKFSRQDLVSPLFKWCSSDWGTFCPVSMFDGIYRKGDPKFGVHFANKIFFLSDQNNYDRFWENPRPFLLPPFPRPGKNVLVIGPPVSGKTSVSKCLGFYLDAHVVETSDMQKEFVMHWENAYKNQVKQTAIAEAMEILRKEQEDANAIKLQEIEKWEEETTEELTRVLKEIGPSRSIRLSSFPMMIETERPDADLIKQKLSDLNFANADVDYLKQALSDRKILRQHLPSHLKLNEEPISVHDPFVLKYADKKVDEIHPEDYEIENSIQENMYDMYAEGIRGIQNRTGHTGWIIDGMTTDTDLLRQFCEEFSVYEVILLTARDYQFLVDRFKEGDKHEMQIRDFRNILLECGEKEAALNVPSDESASTLTKEFTSDILDSMITSCVDEEVLEAERQQTVEKYERAILSYKEKIEEVKSLFTELGISFIWIDVDDLTAEELIREVMSALLNKYRLKATEFTDADRAEEVQQMLLNMNANVEGEGLSNDDLLASIRRYGDTSFYCPVTFCDKFVLWRGKEQFACKFKDKIYLCATESNMKSFIKSPKKYLLQVHPPNVFPPPRVCIIGFDDELTDNVAKALARNLGVRHVNMLSLKRDAVQAFSVVSLLINVNTVEIPDAVAADWFDKVFNQLWFIDKHIGFVVSNLITTVDNLESMIFREAIPDAIICLNADLVQHLKKFLDVCMEKWREDNESQRKNQEMFNSTMRQVWEENRQMRYNELMEIRRQKLYSEKIASQDEDNLRSETQISIDSVAEQQEQDEVARILDEEFPEPVVEENLESEEEARQNYTTEIETAYKERLANFDEIKKICNVEQIPYFEIDSNQDLEKIIRQAYIIGNEIKFRESSFFERCYDVSLDLAEKLLANGYFLLSAFGRLCPVQNYEGYNLLHMFFSAEGKYSIYPVIHRAYIYFITGKKSHDMFVANPLKYTSSTKFKFPLVPLRVSIIGPPKCGKTVVANRFKKDFGFTALTRGQAIRYVLANPLYTNLRESVMTVLRKGDELSDDLVVLCVEAASFCGEAITQGLLFDGFPNSIAEQFALSRLGLTPHLILDLRIDPEQMLKQAASLTDTQMPYSRRFIEHLFNEWKKSEDKFRSWCDREYQNLYRLPVDRSIWGVWDHAKELTLSVVFERKHYYKHIDLDWPLRVAYMLVTPHEFLERQSNYKTYCPACIYYLRRFTFGGSPPDRTGLVHYRKHLYWICAQHIEDFLRQPDKFLPPSNITLPAQIPQAVNLQSVEQVPNLAEEGRCLVCYYENMPKKLIIKGRVEHAVEFSDKTYLFHSDACLNLFMTEPQKYSKLVVNYKDEKLGPLNYKDLPVIGMLEQYVARNLVKAVNSTNIYRPVLSGLSIEQSGLIYVGLKLKIDNPNTVDRARYEEALKIFEERRLNLIKYLDLMKKYLNPCVHYEEPDSPSSTEEEEDNEDVKEENQLHVLL